MGHPAMSGRERVYVPTHRDEAAMDGAAMDGAPGEGGMVPGLRLTSA